MAGSNDSRDGIDPWQRLQAARHGDFEAYDDMWKEMREAVRRAVERSVPGGPGNGRDSRISAIVERVHTTAFEELPDKPADWSTYGWFTWLACREAMDFRSDDRCYESR